MKHFLVSKRNNFSKVVQQLDDYSPLKTLKRGFVYTTDDNGETISSVSQLEKGSNINLHFKDGQAEVVITEMRKDNAN